MNQHVFPASLDASSAHVAFADVLVAWGAFEGKQPRPALYIQNLVGHTSPLFYDGREARTHIRADLLKVHSAFLRGGDTAAAARARSFIAYIDTLKDQTKYSLREYYGRMTGLELKPFTPEQVSEVLDTLLVCMQSVKPGFSRRDLASLDTLLEAAEPAQKHAEFVDSLKSRLEEDKATVTRLTGLRTDDVAYDIAFELLGNGHRAQAGWENGRVKVTFAKQLTTYRLTPHENDIRHEVWGHGLQCTRLAEEVKAGRLPLSYGVHTTTGSEIMHFEALAESVSRLFVPTGERSSIAQAHAWYLMHRRMTGFNARLICEAKGEAAGRAYLASEAPYVKKQDADILMAQMLPANRAGVHYPLVYAPVTYALNRFAHAVGPHGFGKFLGEALPTLLDAKGLNDAMERHSGSKRYNLPLAL